MSSVDAMQLTRTSILGAVVIALGCGSKGSTPQDTEASTGTDPTTTASTTDPTATTTTDSPTTTEDPSTGTTVESADTSTSEGSTGDEPVVLAGACALENRVGSFTLLREAEYSSFSGNVADGVVPITVLELVGEGGGCTLLRRNNPFCDPLCTPGTTCDFDGTCIPYPANHDVGVVTVNGLLDAVAVDPTPPNFNYFDTSLMNPAWDPDSLITLGTAGGDYDAFVLHGYGVSMIEPTAESLSLADGQPLPVEWTPEAGHGRLFLSLNVDQHGLTPVNLFCDVEDTGALEIPADIVSSFLEFGVSGYPVAHYYRQTVDSVEIEPGCVELLVRSHHQTPLTVAGHTPCTTPDDCPMDQTCDLMLQTCV